MSIVMDYINTNNLPLLTWLNADPVNISTSPTSFTWSNTKSDSNFDFVQTSGVAFPVVGALGLSFSTGQFLRSREPVTALSTSYTVLHLSTNTNDNTASLISYLKEGTTVSEISYVINGQDLEQNYLPSLLNTGTSIGEVDLSTDVLRIGVSHDVKRGRSNFVSPAVSSSNIINIDTSHKNPTGRLQIGGDTVIDNLYHVLVFTKKLSQTHIQQLLDLLLYSTPLLNDFIYWDLIVNDTWDLLNEATWNNLI